MNTLYVTRGSNILVNTEDNTADRLPTARQGIDYIYYIEEPTHIVYGCGETHCEADAEAGDIAVVFYTDVFKNPLIVVKNEQWAENIIAYRKKEQEEKERWAQSKCDNCINCETQG